MDGLTGCQPKNRMWVVEEGIEWWEEDEKSKTDPNYLNLAIRREG